VLGRLRRRLERPRELRHARTDDRGRELDRRRWRNVDPRDRRPRRRRARPRGRHRSTPRRPRQALPDVSRPRAPLAGALALACLAVPAAAWAQAALLRTSPSASGIVNTPPAVVSLTYSEPVEPRFAIVSVTDASGAQRTSGPPRRSAGDANT